MRTAILIHGSGPAGAIQSFFLLDDGEEDLDLVQPGGVDGGVDHDGVGHGGEAATGGLAAGGGAVAGDDEDAGRLPVLRPGHDAGGEFHEREDARSYGGGVE